jgi:hypothetical protein
MAITAGSILDSARRQAYPWGQGPIKVSEAALLEHLSRLDYQIASKTSRAAPHLLAVQASAVAVGNLAATAAGYALQAGGLLYRDFEWEDKDGNFKPIRVVPELEFNAAPQHPAGVLRGGTFFPADPLNKHWEGSDSRVFFKGDGDNIHYKYILIPTKLVDRTSTLASPDFAEQYFISSLASLLAALQPGVPSTFLSLLADIEGLAQRSLHFQVYQQSNPQTQSGGTN